VRRLAFLMIEADDVAVIDDGAVGGEFVERSERRSFGLFELRPVGARDGPERDVGVHRGLFRRGGLGADGFRRSHD
jgi:hypothetical protein